MMKIFMTGALSVVIWCVSFVGMAATDDAVSADQMSKEEATDGGVDEQARKAFEEGTILYKQEDYVAAAAKFKEAYYLKPSWKLLYNIAQTDAALKRWGLAIEAFEQYLSLGGDDVPLARRDYVGNEIERLRLMVGAVEVDAPDGLTIVVDGVERGMTPLPGRLRVAAGVEHQVVFKDGETDVAIRNVVVGGQEILSLSIGEGGSRDAASTGGAAADPRIVQRKLYRQSRRFRIFGWVSMGIGMAAVTASVVPYVRVGKLEDEIDECTSVACETDKTEARDTALDSGNGLIGLGVLGVGLGTVFLVVSKRKRSRGDRLGTPVSIFPYGHPDGAGVVLGRSF